MEGWVIVLLSVRQCLLGWAKCLILKVGGQVVSTGYYWRPKHWGGGAARRCRTPGWNVSPADSYAGSLTVDLWLKNRASQRATRPSLILCSQRRSSVKSGSSVQKRKKKKKKSRAELCRDTLHSPAQLEAVAMAFLSCWLRISRVRDSRSRSWQVLQTSTGS